MKQLYTNGRDFNFVYYFNAKVLFYYYILIYNILQGQINDRQLLAYVLCNVTTKSCGIETLRSYNQFSFVNLFFLMIFFLLTDRIIYNRLHYNGISYFIIDLQNLRLNIFFSNFNDLFFLLIFYLYLQKFIFIFLHAIKKIQNYVQDGYLFVIRYYQLNLIFCPVNFFHKI